MLYYSTPFCLTFRPGKVVKRARNYEVADYVVKQLRLYRILYTTTGWSEIDNYTIWYDTINSLSVNILISRFYLWKKKQRRTFNSLNINNQWIYLRIYLPSQGFTARDSDRLRATSMSMLLWKPKQLFVSNKCAFSAQINLWYSKSWSLLLYFIFYFFLC